METLIAASIRLRSYNIRHFVLARPSFEPFVTENFHTRGQSNLNPTEYQLDSFEQFIRDSVEHTRD
jgi:hypothetical protein